jgi:5-methylcytosine-specific restriction enzyme A
MAADDVVTFRSVVSDPSRLMGVKAVWGRSREAVMCFSKIGTARSVAQKSASRPFFVTIGGGQRVPNELRGRALEVVRGTEKYGKTSDFVRDPELRAWLSQWPAAITTAETYAIKSEPRIVEDLGLPNRKILENAFDRVVGDDEEIAALWDVLADLPVQRRWDLRSDAPEIIFTSVEGQKLWRLSRKIENDPSLKREAKEQNRRKNDGVIVCEACKFSDAQGKMFDAHHLQPLMAGVRETRIDDLAVLCPTCHRWAHAKAPDILSPLPVSAIAQARAD